MKYILDFDRTVFDMDALYRKIEDTNPDAKTGTLKSLQGISLNEFLFPDALEFFKQHAKEDIQIVSSSFGFTGQWDLKYQNIIDKSKNSTSRQVLVRKNIFRQSTKTTTTALADLSISKVVGPVLVVSRLKDQVWPTDQV